MMIVIVKPHYLVTCVSGVVLPSSTSTKRVTKGWATPAIRLGRYCGCCIYISKTIVVFLKFITFVLLYCYPQMQNVCTRFLLQHTKIPEKLVRYLERTSLVQFQSDEGVIQLHEAIDFANQIKNVDTSNVEPLHTLLENE